MFTRLLNSLSKLLEGAPQRPQLAQFALLMAAGACGGFAALWAGLPLPFMLGGLLFALPLVVRATARGQTCYFPSTLRRFFVGMIGVMIGSTMTPDLVATVPATAVSLIAVVVFVPTVQGLGYLLARKVGGLDARTSVFAAMPGGLIEAVELGRNSGADSAMLILVHFLRILLIVLAMPTIFYFWTGETVGSAGGQTLSAGDEGLMDVMTVVAIAVLGMILGKRLRLPSSHLVGPLMLSAIAHGAGWVSASTPDWLLFTSQLAVGVGLASNFTGSSFGMFITGLRTALVLILCFLGVGFAFAAVLSGITGLSLQALTLSFAPGGVSEMGLIALSMSISPVIVTGHHLVRIFVTVLLASFLSSRLKS